MVKKGKSSCWKDCTRCLTNWIGACCSETGQLLARDPCARVMTKTDHPQSFPDNRVQFGQVLQILIGHVPESSIGVTKLFLLLLIQFGTIGRIVSA
jgi:hypothetical protein